MKKSGIYCITNKINNKKYIGSTCSSFGFKKRWYGHVWSLNNNKHNNSHLQKAWIKYKSVNFEFTILEECSDDLLITREQYWIEYYGSMQPHKGYNCLSADRHVVSDQTREKRSISMSGNRFFYGKHHTEEAKQKLRIANLGKRHSEETRRKMSGRSGIKNSFYGKRHSEETRRKMSESAKVKIFTEDHRKHISESSKLRKHSEETRRKMSESKKGIKNPSYKNGQNCGAHNRLEYINQNNIVG